MRKLLLKLVVISIIGCSGQPFTESESKVEQGNNQAAAGGGSGGSQDEGGSVSVAGSQSQLAGCAGEPQEDTGGSQAQSGSGGASLVAGRPSMGEGGEGGQRIKFSDCLANHQTLACAQVCDSQPTCQGILDCFVRTNSDLTSDCPGFNDTGYSLALEAERNCCHG